jgi:hypothetical protein
MKPRTEFVWRMCGIWWFNGCCYDQEAHVVAGKTPRSKAKYYRPLVGFSCLRNASKVHVPEERIILFNKTLFFVVSSRRRIIILSLSLWNFSFVECWKEDTAILRPWSRGWGKLRAHLSSSQLPFHLKTETVPFRKLWFKFNILK